MISYSSDAGNPFSQHQVDDTVSLPPGNVENLHADVVGRCLQIINEVRQKKHSQSILVVGEAGSGKSHMLADLRRRLSPQRDVVLAGIRLGGIYSGRLWRQIRERFVDELLREYPTDVGGGFGLLRLLENRFPEWNAKQGARSGIYNLLSPKPPSSSLKELIDNFSRGADIDPNLRRLLPRFFSDPSNLAVRDWLRGKYLSEDDARELGVPVALPSEDAEENAAEQIVHSLLQLATHAHPSIGTPTVTVICFDEVEGLFSDHENAHPARRFAGIIIELLAKTGTCVVITFVRPNTWSEKLQKVLEFSHLQKLRQTQLTIPPLNLEKAVEVVKARLEAWTKKPRGTDPTYPIGHEFIDSLYRLHQRNLTPRQLIMACHEKFNQWQSSAHQGRLEPLVPAVDHLSDHSIDRVLQECWDRLCDQLTRKFTDLCFDSVVGVTLPWIVSNWHANLSLCEDLPRPFGDINFVLRAKRASASWGMSFCNHEPRLLWHRLDRLLKQWNQHRHHLLNDLILLRLRTARTTEKGQERLRRIESAGARILYLENQQFVELAAYQSMLTEAHEGNLTFPDGQLIDETVFTTWAQKHLSPSVKEFVDALFGPPDSTEKVPTVSSSNRTRSTL